MPAAARLGDKAQVAADAHGCPACPHPCVGPIVVGSTDVFINKLAAARLDDLGVHAACCGGNTFTIAKGSPTVYVNGKALARMNDKCTHCGGDGPIIEGSPNVMIDDGVPDAAAVAALKAIQIAIKLAQAVKVALKEAKNATDTLESKAEKASAAKAAKAARPIPTHEAHDAKKETEKEKEKAHKKKEEAEQHEKEKEKLAKEQHAKAAKEKQAKQSEVDVEVELALVDAGDPTQPLVNAQVEYIAYGKTHPGKTDKDGKLKAKLKGKKDGTFEVVVKTQGVLPAFEPPAPKPAPASHPEGDTGYALDVTAKQLEEIMPGAEKSLVNRYCVPLNQAMREFEINSERRQAAFIAQLAEESGEFRWVEELGTGAGYDGRKDLGNTQPGDGPKYKGRGLIQITGRSNYAHVGKALKVDLINHPERLTEPLLACRASAYWYYARGLNKLADAGDFHDICVHVNGGTNGLAVREEYWARAKKVLGNSIQREPPRPTDSEQELELALVDAANPKQGLAGAKVKIAVGGKTINATVGKDGKLKEKIKAPAGSTFAVTVESQGVLPALNPPAHKPPPSGPANPPPVEKGPADAVTAAQIHATDPHATLANIERYLPYLQEGMAKYHINTPIRRAAFIANLAEESWDFAHVTEVGVPQTQFMGRGLIQITGEGNYKAIAAALNIDCVNHPNLLTEPKWAALSACYFFYDHKLNAMAEEAGHPPSMSNLETAFGRVCWAINGGNNGEPQRLENWHRAVKAFGVKV